MLKEPMTETNWLSKNDNATRYLNIYVAEIDWNTHIARVFNKIKAQGYSPDEAKDRLRKIIACTILLPIYDKQKVPDPPENLIYWCPSWHQFNDRDWYALLEEVHAKDVNIAKWRNQSQSLGIIDPIDYSPITRQAFNWLYGAAEESGSITAENQQRLEQAFKKLVWAYGGAVICSLFQKPDAGIKRKVHNWRTNYFFERLIFDNYSIDQVIKIKRQELKKTNPKLVKQIRKL